MIDNRETLDRSPARSIALDCLEAGIRAGAPETVIRNHVTYRDGTLHVDGTSYTLDPADRVIIVGAGKAAARQAHAIESVLGDRIDDGLVISTESKSGNRIAIRQGDHPIPSHRNVAATRDIRDLVTAADERTIVIVLISGGGSALLVDPADPVTLEDLRTVTDDLLASGAPITDINAVRKHLSRVKGGQLATVARPATVIGLALSDVVGDDPGTIASGPTVPDSTTFDDALAVLDRHDIDAPPSVMNRLRSGSVGELPETPHPTDSAISTTTTHVIGTGLTTLRAAASVAEDRGYHSLLLSTRLRGESRTTGQFHREIGTDIRETGIPCEPPAVILSGGETTVSVDGDGRGGPNQEFALAAAIDLPDGIAIGAIDTDGIDGTGPAAGALVDATTVAAPDAARAALTANDTYEFLANQSDAIHTGQTGTNLNDLRVIVVPDDGGI